MAGIKRERENETSKFPSGLKKPRRFLMRWVLWFFLSNSYLILHSTMVDIICPHGWDRINCSAKNSSAIKMQGHIKQGVLTLNYTNSLLRVFYKIHKYLPYSNFGTFHFISQKIALICIREHSHMTSDS